MSEAPDPLDLLELDALLSDAERSTRDRVRAFVDRRVRPDIEEWFAAGVFPVELSRALGELGVLEMHLEGYGCAGASAVEHGLACMEIEAGDSGIRSFVSVQGSLAMFPIHRFGSDEQKDEWLPRMATGEAIGCFALTEPGAGSDPGSMTTHARREGGDWILRGHKKWNTNGIVSDLAIVWAQTDDGIRGFVMPSAEPGVRFAPLDNAWSLRAAARSELFLEDVRLPAGAVLPGVTGLRGPLSCLTEARFGIAFGAMGAARDCLRAALAHAVAREQFGKPIGSFQLVQEKLANMALELAKGTLLALRLGRMKDAGEAGPEHASLGKLANARQALEISREARAILGGDGITSDHPVIRHMMNLESVLTYEGTQEIHSLIVGAALTGMKAFT
ncbi:MAG: acyl-CoA dehydrogenase family protein [Actinomycetota bacterium]|nr:acyl-CoA dehydrogenase family protein [Actinomycetota bacterium]